MYGYCNMPPWWGMPPMNYPYPPQGPPTKSSIKEMIREWKAWDRFNKQREEDKKKKDNDKKPKGPNIDAFYVFIFMTAASPVVGSIVTALKDFIVAHLQ